MNYTYPFSNANEASKQVVWQKGHEIPTFDPSVWRHDICGAVMKYGEHGNTNSQHGWEIDHVYPRALGGKTELDNLQPLNWRNNRAKGDTYPWQCGS